MNAEGMRKFVEAVTHIYETIDNDGEHYKLTAIETEHGRKWRVDFRDDVEKDYTFLCECGDLEVIAAEIIMNQDFIEETAYMTAGRYSQ